MLQNIDKEITLNSLNKKKISNFNDLSKMRALKKIKLFYLPNLTHIDYLKNFL
mgnify:CR=1 FL=1